MLYLGINAFLRQQVSGFLCDAEGDDAVASRRSSADPCRCSIKG